MEELYISRKEAQVHDEMLRLLQEKERLDQIKKEVEKNYTSMSLQCPIPNDKIYKIAKGRFDRETAPTTTRDTAYYNSTRQSTTERSNRRSTTNQKSAQL